MGLLPSLEGLGRLYEQLGYHDYEGVAINAEERERLVRDLGSARAMILRNHGLLTAGRSIGEAFNAMMFLELACKVQIGAMTASADLHLATIEAARLTAKIYRENSLGAAERDWPAMRRLADKLDASYKS